MFYLAKLKTTERISPNQLDENIENLLLNILKEKYEGKCYSDLGNLLYIFKISNIEGGDICYGNGDVLFDVEFEALIQTFTQNETVICVAHELSNFGIFANTGCFKGLIHISQIFDGRAVFDQSDMKIKKENSNEEIVQGDILRAKITGVSIYNNVMNSKIHMTMRQPGLGKLK
jgi:DNA-directed RNA polymerase subunit RpoE